MAKKFERAGRRNTKDAKGTVRIAITLFGKDGYQKGNLTKTITVRNAKVSAVYAAVDRNLGGK